MNSIDIVILLCFIPALVQGVKKGFIDQAASLLAIVLGIWLSFRFAQSVSSAIAPYIHASEQTLLVIAFAIILIAVVFGLHLVGRLIKGVLKLAMLGWVDKLLGAVFAFIKTTLIIGLVIIVFDSINSQAGIIHSDAIGQSVLYKPIKHTVQDTFPYLKKMIVKK